MEDWDAFLSSCNFATLIFQQKELRDHPQESQRKRDDNKNKICAFQGGLSRGAGRKIVQNAIFHGKRHDNKILKVKFLLSRKFVVMAQAPRKEKAHKHKQTFPVTARVGVGLPTGWPGVRLGA